MKNRNRIIAVLFVLGLGFSCTDESTYPIDFDKVNNSNAGILSQVNIISVAFDKFNIPAAKYEVELQANDANRGKLFTSVDIFVSYADRTPSSTNGDNSKNEVKVETHLASEFVENATTGLPRLTISITATAAIAALGLTAAELEGSDQFIFRQAMNFPDGRVFSSGNVNTAIASGGGVYKSPFQNIVPVVCPSDLGGAVNYSSTNLIIGAGGGPCGGPEPVVGTTQFTVLGPGLYGLADASFGFWAQPCYGVPAGSLGVTLSDACNVLGIGGADQYGDTYEWTLVSNNGTTLVIDWTNTYGDVARVALTRTGKTWPLGLTIP